jgi:N-methylhydantoinase A
VTDANVLLGRLNGEALLDGQMPIERRRAEEAVDRLAAQLGLERMEVAHGIVRVVCATMVKAIRTISVERGHDPARFALFAFGGAGPLHAAALARELGIPRLLIPARPGITNALGCVVADLRHDYVNTVNRPVASLDANLVGEVLRSQAERGRALLAREGIELDGTRLIHSADMQFRGQSHILTVALPGPDVTGTQLQAMFERAYYARFGVELPEIRAVLVNLHTAVIGRRPRLDPALLSKRAPDAPPVSRDVWFDAGWLPTPVYQRDSMPSELEGPAVIEQLDCTTLIEPGNRARLDALGNLIVEV